MEFYELCNMVARDLPEGYRVVITIGAGWGGVELLTPDGETLIFQDKNTLEEDVQAAVAYAIEAVGSPLLGS